MIKLLHIPFLIAALLITSLGYSQTEDANNHNSEENIDMFLPQNEFDTQEKEDYNFEIQRHSHKHENHNHDVSLMDIISSDEGTDFNCSGGFCMNKSHYHKKGLTLKRQFFEYFVRIKC